MTKISVFSTLILVLTFSFNTMAQVKIPPLSSTVTITQSIGIHEMKLTYQRPNMNGRTIFGQLVPYGEVWRTGANGIPVITFAEEVIIEGNKVPAGTYGLLTIPEKDNWTIILTKNAQQWGAYEYKEAEDFLRFKVKASSDQPAIETFTINFEEVTPTDARVAILWENTKVTFGIRVDQSAEIIASIEEAMKGEKKPYLPAAQYYYLNGLDINKAVEWAALAEEENASAPWVKYWRARIQLKAGDKEGAIATAKRGIDVATATNNQEYIKLNQQVLEEAGK